MKFQIQDHNNHRKLINKLTHLAFSLAHSEDTSMSTLKFTSKFLPSGATAARGAWSPRVFVTAAPRPLQSKKDIDTAETCQNVKEAAEAVKQGAREVRKTSEFIRDMASSTAESVSNMTKEATDKVSDAAENIKEKAKDSVSGAFGTAKATTEKIKEKIVGK